MYRPPNTDIKQFLLDFQVITKSLSAECLITGDFNLNLLKHDVHNDTGCFLNGLLHDSFIPLITRPTHFNENSSTLIDNIFSNRIINTSTSGTLITDISDHLPVFYIKNEPAQCHSKKVFTYYKRNINDNTIDNLKRKLSQIDWSRVYECIDVDKAYDLFLADFTSCYDQCLPLQRKTVKIRNHISKPWITSGILKSIRKKNKLYKDTLINKSEQTLQKYVHYKNKLTKIIRKAEKMHYSNKFAEAKNNLALTWQVIKKLITPDQTKKQISQITVENKTITDSHTIANKFNDYFVNIGPQLAKKIPTEDGDPISYIGKTYLNTMAVYETDQSEIVKITNELKISTSKGHDDFLPKVINDTISELAAPLSAIFNLSFTTGIFPDQLKVARVVPIYKSDDKTSVNNYRPISVLPFFSKILERIMYNRMLCFLNKGDTLVKNQYGFREKHSTSMALLKLVDQITEELNNKQFSIGIFIDLSKAFDTIDHSILIRKLQHYGIRGIALNWFKSYLQNRQQYVSIGDNNSYLQFVSCGVPQGSILGPLLFIVYINDIANVSKIANLIMFADDTNLFYSHDKLDVLCNDINYDLLKISLWFKLNKLSLNVKKTNFMIFRPKNKKLPNDEINIKIDDISVERVNHTKFLGVVINDKLTWDDHIKTILNKASKSIGIIYRIRHNIPSSTLINLYYTLVHPYYEYCNIVWGSNNSTIFQCLGRSQKRAVRAVVFANRFSHSAPIFKKLHVLTIAQINKVQTACFVYKATNKLLPAQFSYFFTPNSMIHDHNTRQNSKLHLVLHRTKIRANSIRIYGVKIWNSLSNDLRMSPSLNIFRNKYKHQLLDSTTI